MIYCINKDTGELKKFKNVKAVLREINRDRSNEWSSYNKNDWKEGLNEFTEYKLLTIEQ